MDPLGAASPEVTGEGGESGVKGRGLREDLQTSTTVELVAIEVLFCLPQSFNSA